MTTTTTLDQVTRIKMASSLTEYDIAQSKKPHHNFYALGHYLRALNRCDAYAKQGYPLRDCLLNCFNGRLLDRMLKVCKLPTSTKAEAMGDHVKLPELETE